jgi:hypothetical protein
MIPLDQIRLDGDTQPRESLDLNIVDHYAQDMLDGTVFPPGKVRFDGSHHWLSSGYHRYHARRKADFKDMECEVRPGTRDDARWDCLAENKAHGLRRTNADKARAVKLALKQKPESSAEVIAEHVGVSVRTVFSYRKELEEAKLIPVTTQRQGADGRTINTSNIGKTPSKPTDSTGPMTPATSPKAPVAPLTAIDMDFDGPGAQVQDSPPPQTSPAAPPVKPPTPPQAPAAADEPEPEKGEGIVEERDTMNHDETAKPATPAPQLDENGRKLDSPALVEAFKARAFLNEAAKAVSDIKVRVANAVRTNMPGLGELRGQEFEIGMTNMFRVLRAALPFAVCPWCGGAPNGCKTCKGHGWVTESVYKHAPDELKIGPDGKHLDPEQAELDRVFPVDKAPVSVTVQSLIASHSLAASVAEKLQKLGLNTIADLAAVDIATVREKLLQAGARPAVVERSLEVLAPLVVAFKAGGVA